MKHEFSKELECLSEIEELFENTNLLQNEDIREHYELLLKLRDELIATNGKEDYITESILEDIAIITKELTDLIEHKDTQNETIPFVVKKSASYH